MAQVGLCSGRMAPMRDSHGKSNNLTLQFGPTYPIFTLRPNVPAVGACRQWESYHMNINISRVIGVELQPVVDGEKYVQLAITNANGETLIFNLFAIDGNEIEMDIHETFSA